jgi:predicted PurR-regulated permease PerM
VTFDWRGANGDTSTHRRARRDAPMWGRKREDWWPEVLPDWLKTLGIAGWMITGASAAVIVFSYVFSTAASIMVPLVLAFVIGVVAFPLVERLQKRGMSKSVSAVLVLVLLLAIAVGVVWITVAGIVSQWPEISNQFKAGLTAAASQLSSMGIDEETVSSALTELQASASEASKSALTGAASAVGAGLASLFGILFSVFIAFSLLYYVLSDYPSISSYLAVHMGLPPDLGSGVVQDASDSLRGYFKGTTMTGLAVASVIGVGVALLGVPLAIPIALVTFLTCYIPYVGAIISGAFAFVIAWGSNGLTTALIVLVLVLVTQNLLQTVIQAKAMGTALELHPIVILAGTMLGGIFAGLLGAALAAPLIALSVRAIKRISSYSPEEARRAARQRGEPELADTNA